jgi:hypothetical protein
LGESGGDSDISPDCAAVTDALETRYTRSADGTNLAYQVSGDGPLDLVYPCWGIPMDFMTDDVGFLRVRRRLDPFSSTLRFDPEVWAHQG